MTESEILARWKDEEPAYRAWGRFVSEQIVSDLCAKHVGLDWRVFLKIPCEPRTKTSDSLLGKAFRVGKSYADRYGDIEDKVGVRFVVLLAADLDKLQRVIEASPEWTASLDRDFEAERDLRPMEFAYQSKHYVLKSKKDFEYGGQTIKAGMPCEIQLRTLLQHAHSELTHDNIYKRKEGGEVSRKVQRTIAKSMALIEVVDEHFAQAVRELEVATEPERRATTTLIDLFAKYIGRSASLDRSTSIVLQAFPEELDEKLGGRIEELLAKKAHLVSQVQANFDASYVFRQPWILFVFLLASTKPMEAAERWPLTKEELEPVYNCLGLTA